MAELRKYKSFDELKLEAKSGAATPRNQKAISELEAFLKKLQSEYFNQKKTKAEKGKQPN